MQRRYGGFASQLFKERCPPACSPPAAEAVCFPQALRPSRFLRWEAVKGEPQGERSIGTAAGQGGSTGATECRVGTKLMLAALVFFTLSTPHRQTALPSLPLPPTPEAEAVLTHAGVCVRATFTFDRWGRVARMRRCAAGRAWRAGQGACCAACCGRRESCLAHSPARSHSNRLPLTPPLLASSPAAPTSSAACPTGPLRRASGRSPTLATCCLGAQGAYRLPAALPRGCRARQRGGGVCCQCNAASAAPERPFSRCPLAARGGPLTECVAVGPLRRCSAG